MYKGTSPTALLVELADTIDNGIQLGKIDWSKIINLIIQILPLILALFAQDEKPKE